MSNKIHFIGIGGIGLSALARFLHKNGYEISGSDMKVSPITQRLQEEGIKVSIPQKAENITDQSIVIYSAAVKADNPEIVAAKERGMLLLSRKEALPFILKGKKLFAVAGAHGKSTTSAMLASVIEGSVIIGAESKQFGSNMHYTDGENLIFEADESDASFLNTNPYIAIVTNAEPEHMEFYHYDLERFYDAYRTFIKKAKIRVLNAEDPFLSTLDDIEAIRLYPSRDIQQIKTVIIDDEPYTSFILKDLGTFEVYGVGEHIAINAALTILAAITQNSLEEVRTNLRNYRGIRKRFDILEKDSRHVLIDDYAHHPTEIEATIKSARKYARLMGLKRVIAIWQPHKYSRTIDNLEKFKECFAGIDELVILPVYNVGEEPRFIDFERHFSKYHPLFADRVMPEGGSLKLLRDASQIKAFDEGLIIGLGAGDITYQLRGVV
ncbi:MAG TPA: UDP-N-acetylmuramate--L-alanine ligase [Campylobacteraceae bacterium]|nr:UDP-N-acetylmuramate--L-alanine ligase [Campylobacteraceae bacterium]